MLSEKNIVVTIGNYGAIVTLHNGNKIENDVFFTDLNEEGKAGIANICKANKKIPIYVLLDTIDQSYKKKIYPAVTRYDLNKIIKRDMASDGDPSSLKGYLLMNSKSAKTKKVKESNQGRWECLFISSSDSELTNKWIDFLLEMPNRLAGIYMSPVETFGLFKALQNTVKLQSKTKNKRSDICCIILGNKVSGTRQIVFTPQGIIFTRIVNYDFDKPDFPEKYEHDIYSTFEYLKRISPNLSITDLDIVNIFSDKIISTISGAIHNPELSIINLTPSDAAAKCGFSSISGNRSDYCDELISKIFSKKKILKFTNPKISAFEKFYLVIKGSYYLTLLMVAMIFGSGILILEGQKNISESVYEAETKKYDSSKKLADLKKLAFEGAKINEENKVVSAERVIDFGKIDEVLNIKVEGFDEYFSKLKFLRKSNIKLKSYSYKLNQFTEKSPSSLVSTEISIAGNIINKNGDIDGLFKEFDSFVGETKKNFSKSQLKYEELPRTLDFNTKYFSYPVKISISDNPNLESNHINGGGI